MNVETFLCSQHAVSGSIWLIFLYDVAEEIDLGDVRRQLGAESIDQRAPFRHPTPEYVRFERPPVSIDAETVKLPWSDCVASRVHVYDYGIVGLQLEVAFSTHWDQIVQLLIRCVTDPALQSTAYSIVSRHLDRISPALKQPYSDYLLEDYYIVNVVPAHEDDGTEAHTDEILREHSTEIAKMIRADHTDLSTEELTEILNSRISYSPTDLTLVGWAGAFVYDTREGAESVMPLLEYANAQLLEFRRYDNTLSALLKQVYGNLEKRRGMFHRWRLAAEAERLNRIRLDTRELTERMDNSIKFLSDMFSARLYRLAASKIGVPDYRRLVDEELKTGHELYQFMMDQFHHSRAFVLELMVVIILIIDMVYLIGVKH